jgi:hypothetical protein
VRKSISADAARQSSAGGERPHIPDHPPPLTGRGGGDDPRMAAFGDLLSAVDSADRHGVLAAARRLRALNFSVVVLSPRGQGGRR